MIGLIIVGLLCFIAFGVMAEIAPVRDDLE